MDISLRVSMSYFLVNDYSMDGQTEGPPFCSSYLLSRWVSQPADMVGGVYLGSVLASNVAALSKRDPTKLKTLVRFAKTLG